MPGAGVLALVLWALSLPSVHPEDMSGWGLLPALPALWYVAFGVAVAGVVGALVARGRVAHTVVVPLAALVALLFATTSAVYATPRYPWTYKHLGVTEYVLQHWSVDRSIDIYHNFPGFFFLAAGISKVTGIAPMTLAQWTQPVLSALTAAAVYWAVGALTSSGRIRYGAVLLYLLGDWIGQNYFAPQGLAFPVALFVLGGLLRSVPPGAAGLRWARLRALVPEDDDGEPPGDRHFWAGRRGTALLVIAFAFVVVSHPLSPVILLGQSVVICVLLRPARPWLPVAFVAVELFWLMLAWPFLSSTYDLFEFGVTNIEPPEVSLVEPLPGYELGLWAAPLLMAVLALLTVYSVLRGLRRPGGWWCRWPWRPCRSSWCSPSRTATRDLPGLPLRAALAGVPRLGAVLRRQRAVGAAPAPAGAADRRRRRPRPAGQLRGRDELPGRRLDVDADVWFEQNTPDGSVLLPFTSAYPWRATAGYADHLPDPTRSVVGLTEFTGFAEAAEDQTDLVEFTQGACEDQPRRRAPCSSRSALGRGRRPAVRADGALHLPRLPAGDRRRSGLHRGLPRGRQRPAPLPRD